MSIATNGSRVASIRLLAYNDSCVFVLSIPFFMTPQSPKRELRIAYVSTSYYLLTSYFLPLAPHLSSLISHLSSLISHSSPLIPHLSFLASYSLPLTSRLSFLTSHSSNIFNLVPSFLLQLFKM